jgi:hypothetical protein
VLLVLGQLVLVLVLHRCWLLQLLHVAACAANVQSAGRVNDRGKISITHAVSKVLGDGQADNSSSKLAPRQ